MKKLCVLFVKKWRNQFYMLFVIFLGQKRYGIIWEEYKLTKSFGEVSCWIALAGMEIKEAHQLL